jgi:hypothetical protein
MADVVDMYTRQRVVIEICAAKVLDVWEACIVRIPEILAQTLGLLSCEW